MSLFRFEQIKQILFFIKEKLDLYQVKQFDDTVNGSRLYGFYKDPPLDVLVVSSELHSTSLPAKSQKASYLFKCLNLICSSQWL